MAPHQSSLSKYTFLLKRIPTISSTLLSSSSSSSLLSIRRQFSSACFQQQQSQQQSQKQQLLHNNNNQNKRYFASSSNSKVSALSLNSKKRHGNKITMVTAYDYPSAIHVARAGIDIILVGDSVAMVELGYETTQPMTVQKMIHHCQAVKRGVEYAASTASSTTEEESSGDNKVPLLVGDMPFGSYEYDDTDVALRNAYKFVQEAGMDAVKLEGGSLARARTARKIVDGGVAVMGHIGLTPQAISVIGGFRAQGRTAKRARSLVDDALRLQDSGCFSIVLECVPSNVAYAISQTLEIPTIGIGAGPDTSGQVLVYHDMLGMLSHPHHEQFVPKFCKKYAQVGHTIQSALQQYKSDVENNIFPNTTTYSPYVMSKKEQLLFDQLLEQDEQERQRKHNETVTKLTEADEWESLSLYGGSSKGGSGGGGGTNSTDKNNDNSNK